MYKFSKVSNSAHCHPHGLSRQQNTNEKICRAFFLIQSCFTVKRKGKMKFSKEGTLIYSCLFLVGFRTFLKNSLGFYVFYGNK
jgi:hypothetical protein